jgi:hypothetical protein
MSIFVYFIHIKSYLFCFVWDLSRSLDLWFSLWYLLHLLGSKDLTCLWYWVIEGCVCAGGCSSDQLSLPSSFWDHPAPPRPTPCSCFFCCCRCRCYWWRSSDATTEDDNVDGMDGEARDTGWWRWLWCKEKPWDVRMQSRPSPLLPTCMFI